MTQIFKHLCFVCVLCLTLINSYAQDPNFHIYLAFGQSNMEGQGDIEQQDQAVSDRFQILQSVNCDGRPQGVWRTATPPLSRCNTKLGPVDNFGKTMVANLPDNIKVGVVLVAVSGCKIEMFDKDAYQNEVASAPAWQLGAINEYGGNPYNHLLELAQQAQQEGVIKGILLHQGESNSGEQAWPSKVNKVYNDLLNDLGLNADNVPLLSGQVVDAEQGGLTAGHNTIIDNLPNTIPTAHVISASGCTHQGDNLHFSSAGYRLLGERYAETMLSLIELGGISVQFTSHTGNTNVQIGEDIELSFDASDEDGTLVSIELFDGDELLTSFDNPPYNYTFSSDEVGTHKIRAVATDNEGNVTQASINLIINVPQTPYTGTPHQIPGMIELEEFDLGGNGFAYYDDSEGSETGSTFRNEEDVDIEACTDQGGGYNIGWFAADEWLEYTVDIQGSGTYDIEIRVAVHGDGRTIDLALNDELIASEIDIPNTGGWQTWQTLTLNNVHLDAGESVLRLTMGAENYANLNKITFNAVNISNPPTTTIVSPKSISSYGPTEDILIEVEAQDSDGTVQEVALYHNGELWATDETVPYSFDWSSTDVGTHQFVAIATDDQGIEGESEPIVLIIEPIQTPYSGVPHAIPGRIEFEEYDHGGEGVGYHEENTNGNEGGAGNRNDEVDIEPSEDESNLNIGYTLENEWLAYTVDVDHTGTYDLGIRVAKDGEDGVFHLEIDGNDITGPISVPNTGGWQNWETITVSDILLNEGVQDIKVIIDANYINLNYMQFTGVITSQDEIRSEGVFPNPFDHNGLVIDGAKGARYLFRDLNGLVLKTGVYDNKAVGSNLPAGVYILELIKGNETIRLKVVKQ